ncbi:hypothetical protein LTR85_008196 [Meristemomyces frigidus]|nr:hypothetical protein LTR85_008196 [Meristemomyces frigidus]
MDEPHQHLGQDDFQAPSRYDQDAMTTYGGETQQPLYQRPFASYGELLGQSFGRQDTFDSTIANSANIHSGYGSSPVSSAVLLNHNAAPPMHTAAHLQPRDYYEPAPYGSGSLPNQQLYDLPVSAPSAGTSDAPYTGLSAPERHGLYGQSNIHNNAALGGVNIHTPAGFGRHDDSGYGYQYHHTPQVQSQSQQ